MKQYIAFLRGVNIGGRNKISMPLLKQAFEELSFREVYTYINSGNIIFSSDLTEKVIIVKMIEEMIQHKFSLDILVLVLAGDELKDIVNHAPNWWGKGNKEVYDNLIFMIPPSTYKEIYNQLGEPKEDLEKVQEYKNYIFWTYDLKNYRKTNWWSKTANKSVANKITIRTANTVYKLIKLLN